MVVDEVPQPREDAGLLLLTDGCECSVTKEVVGHGETVTHLHVLQDQPALDPEREHQGYGPAVILPLTL